MAHGEAGCGRHRCSRQRGAIRQLHGSGRTVQRIEPETLWGFSGEDFRRFPSPALVFLAAQPRESVFQSHKALSEARVAERGTA